MNNEITPPPELVLQWLEDGLENGEFGISEHIATQAARWGADQELEACIAWMKEQGYWADRGLTIPLLRAARRPKTPSLKVQALEALEALPKSATQENTDFVCVIRRALEQLDD